MVAQLVKNLPDNAGNPGWIPGMENIPGEGIGYPLQYAWASLVAQWVKNPPVKAEDLSSISGSGRSPREETCNPLQYPCLENPMDRGAWLAVVHRITKSWA